MAQRGPALFLFGDVHKFLILGDALATFWSGRSFPKQLLVICSLKVVAHVAKRLVVENDQSHSLHPLLGGGAGKRPQRSGLPARSYLFFEEGPATALLKTVYGGQARLQDQFRPIWVEARRVVDPEATQGGLSATARATMPLGWATAVATLRATSDWMMKSSRLLRSSS